jgi:splicing factor 45
MNSASFDVEDPYEPSRPNDYLAYCEERLEQKRLAKLAEENNRKLIEIEQARAQLERERQDAVEKGDVQRLSAMGAGRGRGRGLSNLPAWMTQGQPQPQLAEAPGSIPEGPSVGGQFDDTMPQSVNGNVAARIMSKMGYQEGEGLGKDGLGITQPIEHRKVGAGGQIVMSDEDRQRYMAKSIPTPVGGSAQQPQPGRKRQGLFSNPSCVVLLKNMVGPNEVDDMLADETKAECLKYGPINTCVVFEVKEQDCPPEECVRTFIAFEKQVR